MSAIHDAEQALRRGRQDEKSLRRYSVAVLQELCAKCGIQVSQEHKRRLKKPYIEALLTHVRRHSSLLSTDVDNQVSKGEAVAATQIRQD
jgi:hypothetical protein